MTAKENKTPKQQLRENSKEEARPPGKLALPFWAVFCISAWMFFVGVLVGRGTSPVNFDIHELEKQIAELKKAAFKSEQTVAATTDALPSDAGSRLEFYDALKMAEKNVPVPVIESKSKVTVKKPEMADPGKMETKDDISVPKPQKAAENSGKNYSIQVASLKDPVDAIKLVELFKQKGYSAYHVSAEIQNSGTWNRVRIGPFKSQSEALRVLSAVGKEHRGALILEHEP